MGDTQRRISWGELACAGAAVVWGVVLLVGARGISFAAGYDRIGPRFFPYSVGVGLIILGVALGAYLVLGRGAERETGEPEPIAWRPLGLVTLALVATVLLYDPAGFVIASAAQVWLVARGFGSGRPIRDTVVAVVLSAVVYVAFSRGLGLTLPAGILERFS